jgi:hypothetical protein
MLTRRLAPLLLALLLLAGCGGSDDDADRATDSTGEKATTTESTSGNEDDGLEQAPPIETQPDSGGGTSASSFELTPAIQDCMRQAGFEQDAPPTSAVAAWRHPSGARVVVAASEQESVLTGIADEIGSGSAQVDGAVVHVGPEAPTTAALACLE